MVIMKPIGRISRRRMINTLVACMALITIIATLHLFNDDLFQSTWFNSYDNHQAHFVSQTSFPPPRSTPHLTHQQQLDDLKSRVQTHESLNQTITANTLAEELIYQQSRYEKCTLRMGSGMLERWKSRSIPFVRSFGTSPTPSLIDTGYVTCNSMVIDGMPEATAPHSFCYGTNVIISIKLFIHADTPAHRSNYGFGNHYRYPPSSFAVIGEQALNDAKKDEFLEHLSRDHMRDSIHAIRAKSDDSIIAAVPIDQRLVLCDNCTLLLVTREGGEHVNLYHTVTDWYGTYLMLEAHGLIDYMSLEDNDVVTNSIDQSMQNVQVMFLDNHASGYLDPLWQEVFSPSHPVLRVRDMLNETRAQLESQSIKSMILARHVVWVPAGYASPIYVNLKSGDMCRDKVDTLARFASFVRRQLKSSSSVSAVEWIEELSQSHPGSILQHQVLPFHNMPVTTTTDSTNRLLRVLLISRRPYSTSTVDHKKMDRQIGNEADLVAELMSIVDDPSMKSQYFSHLHFVHVDFARLPIRLQVKLVSQTDIMAGMHGAALGHSIFLPEHGSLLELQPEKQTWRVFQHMSEWSHAQLRDVELTDTSSSNYMDWRNTNSAKEKREDSGHIVWVDVAAIRQRVIQLIQMRERRENATQRRLT